MRFAWLTDTHFDFISPFKLFEFFDLLNSQNLSGIFLTGDISTGPKLRLHLQWMERRLQMPIYFTLGNHDFYRSSFERVDRIMSHIRAGSNLIYMTHSEPITIAENTALIGHDGWYDARWRVPHTSFIFIWDWFFIKDFRALFSNEERLELVRERASEAAIQTGMLLNKALKNHDTVYLLTHFPPWPDYSDRLLGWISKFWMPYNSSKIMAHSINDIMNRYPDKKLIILSGHTHKHLIKKISDNIELHVGHAQHGKTEIQEIFTIL